MKKKTIFLMLFLALLYLDIRAQTIPIYMSTDANISVFAGYFAKRQNTNENGNWLGAYADIPLVKSWDGGWNLGVWANYASSTWQSNLQRYSARNQDISLGLQGGHYSENFSYTHSFYGGLVIGYKHSSDKGFTQSKKYEAESVQTDHLISANLNLNIIKYSGFRQYFLPRTQLTISGQIAMNSYRKLKEQDKEWKEVLPWNKAMLETTLKQSVADIPLDYDYTLFLQPKVGVNYNYYHGDKSTPYSFLIELAMHRIAKDDFLSLVWMQKFYPDHDLGIFMISINVLKLK